MKSYFFAIYCALKLPCWRRCWFSSVILRAPKWRASTAGVMGYAAVPQRAGSV